MIEKDIIRQMILDDTLKFACYFFKKQTDKTFVIGAHHRIVCDALNKVLRGETTKLIINIAPRYSKCIAPNTRIYTSRGLIDAKDVREGDMLYSFDQGKLVLQRCQGIEDARKQSVRITMRSGRTIECSYDHPMLTTFGYKEASKIEVGERMSEVVYKDMINSKEYNAAVTLTAMDIMDGRTLGDGTYFMPDETVSKAEFLTMAMKAANIKVDNSTSKTYFDDNDDIPLPLRPYVKSAVRLGIINGEFKDGKLLYRPGDAITKYEAAMIISKLVETTDNEKSVSLSDISSVPVWARDEVEALCAMGIFSTEGGKSLAGEEMTRKDTATCIYEMLKHL